MALPKFDVWRMMEVHAEGHYRSEPVNSEALYVREDRMSVIFRSRVKPVDSKIVNLTVTKDLEMQPEIGRASCRERV